MEEPKLTAKKVEHIFMDCLFNDDEAGEDGIPKDFIIVEGVVNNFGLHPERTESHREEIIDLLKELPDEFRKEGGGWSFLNACDDRHGNQWTGLHRDMEMLFALGIAIKKASFQLPKTMWSVLPGGMPYVVVDV